MHSTQAQLWTERRPQPGETCVFTYGYSGLRGPRKELVSQWKRDSLLFDRVYASCVDPNNPPDIPSEISFGVSTIDAEVRSEDVHSAQGIAQAFAGMSAEEIRKQNPGIADAFDFDRSLAEKYFQAGIMGEWTYSSSKEYLRRFTEGERFAYEGALSNIPLVSVGSASWEQIVQFRSDPDASRKYRDLRLWLREGVGAQSVQHASDIVGRKIDDYRWAIQKHGMETSIGTLKQLFEWKESGLALAAGGLGGALGGPIAASIASGLVIAAKIGAFLCERRLDATEVKRGPERAVAILYEAQERFK